MKTTSALKGASLWRYLIATIQIGSGCCDIVTVTRVLYRPVSSIRVMFCILTQTPQQLPMQLQIQLRLVI